MRRALFWLVSGGLIISGVFFAIGIALEIRSFWRVDVIQVFVPESRTRYDFGSLYGGATLVAWDASGWLTPEPGRTEVGISVSALSFPRAMGIEVGSIPDSDVWFHLGGLRIGAADPIVLYVRVPLWWIILLTAIAPAHRIYAFWHRRRQRRGFEVIRRKDVEADEARAAAESS